jgi:vacuolar protein sorting-associated protein 13A/C
LDPTGGAAGAVSRITGALGKGIASLTMDEDYQRKRREAINKRPADLKEGLARGGQGLVMVCLIISIKYSVFSPPII